jgi:hypothetical protein
MLQRSGAMWCITRHPANEGSARDPRSARERRSERVGGVGEGVDPEHIASDVQLTLSSIAVGEDVTRSTAGNKQHHWQWQLHGGHRRKQVICRACVGG